jgi:hypothetical protein
MKIIFRIIAHKLSARGERIRTLQFTPAIEADGISVTANTHWSSPLISVCNSLGYDQRLVSKASTRCNRFNSIATLNSIKPKLLLVPKTKTNSDVEKLTDMLMDSASVANIRTLNFTHYGFIKDNLPTHEIVQVLHSMKKWRGLSNLKNIIWDIDGKHIVEMEKLNEYITTE